MSKKKKVKSEFNSPQPFNYQGSPGPNNDVSFPSPEKLMKIMNDPKAREAIGMMLKEDAKDFPELFAGKPYGVMKLYQKQCMRDMHTLVHASVNKKVMDLAMKKKGIKP